MKRRIMSAILVLVLVLTFSVPAFAAGYPDLKNHWAKEYMENLALKGYLSGYNDGTMKPDRNITACEALVVLSRLYNLTDFESELIQADYEDMVKEAVPSTLSWSYKNIQVCLAAGIITRDELKSINLNSEIQKEKLALFLVRAMQLTSEAEKLKDVRLNFADADKISSDCRGSAAELVSIKVVTGDDRNNFAPQSSLTRAVAATMVSRSLDYLKANNKTLTIAAYHGVARTEGIITSVNGSYVEISGFDGLTRGYTLASDASVTVNKTTKSLNSLYEGCYTKITLKNGAVIGLAIESESSVKWLQGGVISMSLSSSTNNHIYIKNLKTGAMANYTISANVSVTRDGKTAYLSSITNSDFVTLKYVNNVVTEISAVSGGVELTGTVSGITYGTTTIFKITDSNNIVYSFKLDIAELPIIKRGDKTITIDRLKAGNKVTLKYEKCKVTSIVADGTGNTVTGELTSTTTSASGTVWVITTNGTGTSYTVDEDAAVYNGTTSISLSSIRIGDQVSVVVYNNTITEIYLLSAMSSSTKVSGSVLKVDTSNQMITILTPSDKLVYIKTSSVGSILVASTGNTTYLSSIAVNSKLTAYGSYTDSTTFAAKSIVIE